MHIMQRPSRPSAQPNFPAAAAKAARIRRGLVWPSTLRSRNAPPILVEFGGTPKYQRLTMRAVETQLEVPACTMRRFHASKMLTPRDLARGEGTCALQGHRRIPAAVLFVYVPAPDHVCQGNATRAPLLLAGTSMAPAMLTPGDSAREKGTCVLAWMAAAYVNGRG